MNSQNTFESNIIPELFNFVEDVLKMDFDYIFIIARKGTGLLRLVCPEEETPIWQRVVVSNRISFLPRDRLKDKRVILLDDAIATGEQVAKYRDLLLKKARVKDLKIAAFLVDEEAPKDVLPDYYSPAFFRLPHDRYVEGVINLQKVFFNRCAPLDIDHLIFRLEMPEIDLLKLWTILEKFGEILYLTGENFTYEGQAYISLTDCNFLNDDNFTVPQGFEKEGVVKIRFYITAKGTIRCVPMAFYAIAKGERCALWNEEVDLKGWPIRFCEASSEFKEPILSESKEETSLLEESTLCMECGSFNLALQLGTNFLSEFLAEAEAQKIEIAFIGFNEQNMRVCYPIFQDKIIETINKQISLLRRHK